MNTDPGPPPPLRLEGTSDPRRAQRGQQRLEAQARQRQASANQETRGDFGEQQLAPTRDPVEGLDPSLPGLEIPEFDAQAHVDDSFKERLVSSETVGRELGQVMVVEPERLEAYLQGPEAAAPSEKRQELAAERAGLEEQLSQAQRDGEAERALLLRQARGDVDQQRQLWRGAQDQLCARHREQANALVQEELGQLRRHSSQAEQDAQRALNEAESQAQGLRDQVTREAEAKKSEAEGQQKSWWQRGVDWVKSKLEAVTQTITRMVEVARRNITELISRAKGLARDIIQRGKELIARGLDRLIQNLDQIIALLPEELRQLATQHRGKIQSFLQRAQQQLDAWADKLADKIDGLLDGLETMLGAGLSLFEGLLTTFLEGLEALLDMDLMSWLRANAPALASLLDEGLDGLLADLGEAVGEQLKGALEAIGLDGVFESLQTLGGTLTDPGIMGGVGTGCCECFKQVLQAMMGVLDALLGSAAMTGLQGVLQGIQEGTDEVGLGLLEGFFSLLEKVGGPVLKIIDAVGAAVDKVSSVLGEIGQAVWEHVAAALGLDASLGPIEALKQKLSQMWEEARQALKPLTDAMKEAWAWIQESSPLAPLFLLGQALGDLYGSLKELWAEITADPRAWLGEAVDKLKDSILPGLQGALEGAERILSDASEGVGQAVEQMLSSLGVLDQLQAGVDFLQGVVDAVKGVFAGLKERAGALLAEIRQGVEAMAARAAELAQEVRPLLDFALGLAMAVANPWLLPGFVAGNLFLHVLPECYKEPMWDFVLDVFIKLIEWTPMPAKLNFLGTAFRAGALSFLKALREQPEDKKIKAMDLIASLFAGNAEFVLGLFVGIGKGLWDATVGTLGFALEIIASLASLPVKMAQMVMDPQEDTDSTEGLEGAQELGDLEDPWREAEAEVGQDEVLGETPDEDQDWAEVDEVDEDFEGPEEEAEADSDQPGDPPQPTQEAGSDAGAAPQVPTDLASGKELLRKMFTEGFSREGLEAVLAAGQKSIAAVAGAMGQEAATGLMDALTADGAAYQIGETVGFVIGVVLVEVALAILTAPAGGAAGWGHTALAAAKHLPRVVRLLAKLKKAVAPLLKALQKLQKAIGRWARKVDEFIERLLKWGKAKLKGLGRRTRNPRSPRKGPHHRKGPRGRKAPRAGLRLVAYQAAQSGWRKAQSTSRSRVVTEAQLKQQLKARVRKPNGVRVTTSLVRMGSTWRVKAVATKGAKRATAKVGRGWIAKDTSHKRWYATKSLASFNRTLAQRVETELRREVQNKASEPGRSQLKQMVKRAEGRGDEALRARLSGVDMKLELTASREEGKQRVKGIIEPNYYEWLIEIYDGTGLEEIAKEITAYGRSTKKRYNQQLAYLKGLGEKHKVPVSFKPGPKVKGFPEYISVTFSDGTNSLEVWCHRFDQTEIQKGAITDRSLTSGTGTSKPHDALSARNWKDAFKLKAVSLGTVFNDPGVRKIAALFTGTKGLAVGDGSSLQPFDGEVQSDTNALERNDRTRGQRLSDTYTVDLNPHIGRVTVDEYRGKDWAGMSRTEIKAAMAARIQIAESYALERINAMWGVDRGFTRKITDNGLRTKENATLLVQLVADHVAQVHVRSR